MKKELDDALCRDFPLLYTQRNWDMQKTCMCWGFECGDGWEPLIRRLSEKLEPRIAAYVRKTFCFPCPEDPFPQASQVKEKWGTLHFYMDNQLPSLGRHIWRAERESARTCETCGKPGKLRQGGWITCACDEHSQGRPPFPPTPFRRRLRNWWLNTFSYRWFKVKRWFKNA